MSGLPSCESWGHHTGDKGERIQTNGCELVQAEPELCLFLKILCRNPS